MKTYSAPKAAFAVIGMALLLASCGIASKNRRSEDVVGLAGWLFTDLLLGVSLVFLATTSFQVIGNKGEAACTKYEKTYFPTPLLARYTDTKSAASKIRAQMDEFSDTNGLLDYQVAVALVYGYYEPGQQQAGDGQRFAFSFYNDSLHLADPKNFPKTFGPSLNDTRYERTILWSSSR